MSDKPYCRGFPLPFPLSTDNTYTDNRGSLAARSLSNKPTSRLMDKLDFTGQLIIDRSLIRDRDCEASPIDFLLRLPLYRIPSRPIFNPIGGLIKPIIDWGLPPRSPGGLIIDIGVYLRLPQRRHPGEIEATTMSRH